ncbi:hypothetical protein [Streptomyces sp. NPDC060184]|uniref:hypothetical protein n=1 Tax=Streptomyces sp. NPDC060184 TaxID=3347064 RepID=UPI00364A51F5
MRHLARWLRQGLVVCAALLACGFVFTPTAAQAADAAGGVPAATTGPAFQLISRQTNLCLTAAPESDPYRVVYPSVCSNSTRQLWYWDSAVKNWVNGGSGGCLNEEWIFHALNTPGDPGVTTVSCVYVGIINHVELTGGYAMVKWLADGTCLDGNTTAIYRSSCYEGDLGQQWTRLRAS